MIQGRQASKSSRCPRHQWDNRIDRDAKALEFWQKVPLQERAHGKTHYIQNIAGYFGDIIFVEFLFQFMCTI